MKDSDRSKAAIARMITGEGEPNRYRSVVEMVGDNLRKQRDELEGGLIEAINALKWIRDLPKHPMRKKAVEIAEAAIAKLEPLVTPAQTQEHEA